MENKKLILSVLVGIIVLNSCEKAEVRSVFVPYITADERFEQSMQWNDQNPQRAFEVSGDGYEFFIMGDSHVGGIVNLNRFFDDAVAAEALGVIFVGDLTTGHAYDYDTFEQNLPDPGTINILPIAGNHDIYFDGWKEFYSRFGSSTYYFTVTTPAASDLFICLDSGGGTLGSDQLEWLKELLENSRNSYRYCVLLTHNNLFRPRFTTSTNPLIEELHELIEICLEYDINMTITAHDHMKSVEVFGKTTHIILDALLDGFINAGYLRLTIAGEPEKLDYHFVNF